jgi:hypothetical protein
MSSEVIAKHQALVVTNSNAEWMRICEYNTLCREKNMSFVYAETRGIFGRMFSDFGDDYFYKPQPTSSIDTEFYSPIFVTNISNEEFALVTVHEGSL